MPSRNDSGLYYMVPPEEVAATQNSSKPGKWIWPIIIILGFFWLLNWLMQAARASMYAPRPQLVVAAAAPPPPRSPMAGRPVPVPALMPALASAANAFQQVKQNLLPPKVSPSNTVPVKDLQGNTLGCPVIALPNANSNSNSAGRGHLIKRQPQPFTQLVSGSSCHDCSLQEVPQESAASKYYKENDALWTSQPRNFGTPCEAGTFVPHNALTIVSDKLIRPSTELQQPLEALRCHCTRILPSEIRRQS